MIFVPVSVHGECDRGRKYPASSHKSHSKARKQQKQQNIHPISSQRVVVGIQVKAKERIQARERE
jgi:hypothetical protein